MSVDVIKQKIYITVKKFFKDANVIWSDQQTTRPKLPYVVIRLRNISMKTFPCEDRYGDRVYACSSKLEINLYTKGRVIKINGFDVNNSINTATSDLMEFVNYIHSDEITDYFTANDIAVLSTGNVLDLTELENDSQFVFRAMCEFDISFTQYSTGRYGQSSVELINSSGGDTEGLRQSTQYIEEVEINTDTTEDDS